MSVVRNIAGSKNLEIVFSQVRYEIGGIVPDTSVRVIVHYLNQLNQVIYSESILIEGQEYKSWSNDMDFFDLIDSKLGLS